MSPRKSQAKIDHDESDERRLPPLLRRAWFSLNQAFRRRIAHLGITPDQFTVLRWLSEAPQRGLTQRELADRMTSDANTVTGLLKRMSASGLVERLADPDDGRVKRTRLTASGKRVFAAGKPIAVTLQNDVLSVLGPRQRDQFLRHLQMFADACREELDGE